MTVLSASQTPSALSCPPSYIQIIPDTATQLPAIRSREIVMPDGSISRVLDENARLTDAQSGVLATIQTPTGNVHFGTDEDLGTASSRWYIRGVRFKQQTADLTKEISFIGTLEGRPAVDANFTWGPNRAQPDHIVFNQCEVAGDPTQAGVGVGAFIEADMTYLGILNCRGLNMCAAGAGDPKIVQVNGTGPGPYHIENNEWQTYGAGMFFGGTFTKGVSVVPADILWRRNWHHVPILWRPTECTPYNSSWVVDIATNGTTVNGVSYPAGGGFNLANGPRDGGYMWEPATGKAALVTSGGVSDSFISFCFVSPWPGGGPVSGITVYFQQPNITYNSGVNYPLGQSTTNSTTTVAFAEALPASVLADGTMYFYQNNGHWTGTGEVVPGDGTNFRGVADTPVPRKKIVAIASDRLSCTLATAYGQSVTTTYSISTFDGIKRSAAPKAPFETKCGQRILMEGNVFEFGAEGQRQHPTNQGFGFGPFFGNDLKFTIVGDDLTLTGTYTFDDMLFTYTMPQFFTSGDPWPYFIVTKDPQYSFHTSARILRKVDSTHAKLDPQHNQYSGGVTDWATGMVWFISNPYWHCSNMCWRYNQHNQQYTLISNYADSANEIVVTHGKNYHMHDNLFVKIGDAAHNLNGAIYNVNNPTSASGSCIGAPTNGANGTFHFRHNTSVHASHRAYNTAGWIVQSPSVITSKAEEQDFSDNVLDGFATYRTDQDAPTQGEMPILAFQGSAQSTVIVSDGWQNDAKLARSVFIGVSAVESVNASQFRGVFPDNCGVTALSNVGFTAPDYIDPYRVANYVLTDIYSVGTVSIAANGLSATLTSGIFPTTVVAGQFFKTTTDSTLKRILTVAAGAVTWSGAHPEAGQSGKSYAITFKGSGSDGVDPGANMNLVEQFTRGVKTSNT